MRAHLRGFSEIKPFDLHHVERKLHRMDITRLSRQYDCSRESSASKIIEMGKFVPSSSVEGHHQKEADSSLEVTIWVPQANRDKIPDAASDINLVVFDCQLIGHQTASGHLFLKTDQLGGSEVRAQTGSQS